MKFLPYNPEQAYLLPPRVADVLGKEHFCCFLRRVVDRLDLNSFEEDEGRPAYAPELLVAVWLYAYALGVTSSRRLEQRVREDLAFRYLAAGATPDFWTLNQFRRQHGRALNDLFTQVVELARAAGLGRLGHVAIDSTRVAANASPNRVETKERLAEIPSRLEQLKRARQRHISRTDPDSRFLRDRRGFTLGYTVDVAVSEDHLIVEQRVTQAATDNASLLPVVEAVERRCGEMPQKVSADSGFFSVKNLEALTASGIDAYVPDSNMAHALNRGGRVRHRTRHPEHRRMRQKLRSPTGRAVYRRRKALIEPVFGVLKEQRGMRRFRRRGLAKVAVEMLLAATAYHLTRLYHARPSFVTPPG